MLVSDKKKIYNIGMGSPQQENERQCTSARAKGMAAIKDKSKHNMVCVKGYKTRLNKICSIHCYFSPFFTMKTNCTKLAKRIVVCDCICLSKFISLQHRYLFCRSLLLLMLLFLFFSWYFRMSFHCCVPAATNVQTSDSRFLLSQTLKLFK